MIVRERPSGLRLFFVLRGSILKQIRWVMLANIGLAVLVTLSHGTLFHYKLQVTTIPFTLMGLPLAIFLGFRNNACYDRFWEARKLWGDILLRCRNLSRQLLSLVAAPGPDAAAAPDERLRMIRRSLAFALALKHQLRGTADSEGEVAHWLPAQEAAALVANAKAEADHLRASATTDVERETRSLRTEVEDLQRRREGILAQMGQLRDIAEAEGGGAALDRVGAAEDAVEFFVIGLLQVQIQQHLLHLVQILGRLLKEDLVKL